MVKQVRQQTDDVGLQEEIDVFNHTLMNSGSGSFKVLAKKAKRQITRTMTMRLGSQSNILLAQSSPRGSIELDSKISEIASPPRRASTAKIAPLPSSPPVSPAMNVRRNSSSFLWRMDSTVMKSADDFRERYFKFSELTLYCARFEAVAVIKMLAANISAINNVSIACILNASDNSPFIGLGVCPGGFWNQMLISGLPFFVMDALEVLYFIYIVGMPLYGVFLDLDPFLVVAVLVVTHMNFVLLLAVS
eukprot:CAMPEP_0197538684 /NCGR_PEP_ID=MMETSP1318-20131121/60328_1 /TAXON_ID=552666 /ORGANISM="Partenskyella glossopodia, Strain RCC365" /LENGTH=247 /DNA_ID=CAMNT_0043097167 /DNA_START=102 /DNA_END=845 /DNA_ORIENTATION=+